MGDLIDPSKGAAVFERVWAKATPKERQALMSWLHKLAKIRDSGGSLAGRSVEAVRCTLASEATWPLVKVLFAELTRVGWSQRSSKWRAFLGGSGAGLLLFGSQGAGIAALGGAIGVPLWLVVGGGATLLDTFIKAGRAKGGDSK